MVVACLILTNGQKEIRTFSTMTDELLRLRDWLGAAQCSHVAIESTGVYWKPVFNILEDALTVILINPEHAHALRGRKTDVKDAEWLADLLRHGLLKASFIPPPEIRERSEEHTSELQSRLHLVCRLLLEKKNKIVHAAEWGLHGITVCVRG